ncbi:MAG TPA: PEP-CTERM sorting domain-containing protein [Candidatus Sulfopaludibacter sp.]|jgi:hypothetical protein|nr:PEP-CTERM sorting domain-containing protein [Candidatus Sulfopaludibacter sp.]
MKLAALLLGSVALAILPASATVLYDNSYSNYSNWNQNSWQISNGFLVGNSFVPIAGTATSITFSAWTLSGDYVNSVDWAIYDSGSNATSPQGGNLLASGTATNNGTPGGGLGDTMTYVQTSTNNGVGPGYWVYDETIDMVSGLALTGGSTYWLVLQNAIAPHSPTPDDVWWNQSDGPSTKNGTPVGPCAGRCSYSESFTIDGTVGEVTPPGPTPEPGTLSMLCGGILVGAVQLLRRRKA